MACLVQDDFARAIRASLVGSGSCDDCCANGDGHDNRNKQKPHHDHPAMALTFKGYTTCPSVGRAKNSVRYWADAHSGAPSPDEQQECELDRLMSRTAFETIAGERARICRLPVCASCMHRGHSA